MEKIILKDGASYILVTNGIQENSDSVIITVLASGTILTAQTAFEKMENKGSITVVDENNVQIRTAFSEFTVLDCISLKKDVVVSVKNVGTDTEPKYENETSDVFIISIRKQSISDQMKMLTACMMEMSEAVYG